MAIEIIRKRKFKESRWPIFSFYIGLILLFFVVLVYFVSSRFLSNLSSDFEEQKRKIAAKSEEPILRDREKFLNYQRKFEDFEIILEEQNFNLNFFRFFEKLIHPKVWFSNFTLDSKTKKVSLIGEAEDFITIGEQIYILKKEPMIKEIRISKVLSGKRGVSFKLEMQIDSHVFRFLDEAVNEPADEVMDEAVIE